MCLSPTRFEQRPSSPKWRDGPLATACPQSPTMTHCDRSTLHGIQSNKRVAFPGQAPAGLQWLGGDVAAVDVDGNHLALDAKDHFVPLQVEKGGDPFSGKDGADKLLVLALGLELQALLFAVDPQGELRG